MTVQKINLKINVLSDPLLGESRLQFKGLRDDLLKTKKGIRFHHSFTAFFLRFFGKIVDLEDINGKVYHINKASLNKYIFPKAVNFNDANWGAKLKDVLTLIKKIQCMNQFCFECRQANVAVDTLKNLLKKIGPSVLKKNTQSLAGNFLLHDAIIHLPAEKVVRLLEYFPKCLMSFSNGKGETPLHLALKKWKNPDEQQKSLMNMLARNMSKSSFEKQDGNGDTVLHLAAKHLSCKDLPSFLDHCKISKNVVNHQHDNALNILTSRFQLCAQLIDLLPYFSSDFYLNQNIKGATAILTIFQKNDANEYIEEILNFCPPDALKLQSLAGFNSLHWACESLSSPILLKVLPLFPEESITGTNELKETPLTVFLERKLDKIDNDKSIDVIKLFLKLNSEVLKVNGYQDFHLLLSSNPSSATILNILDGIELDNKMAIDLLRFSIEEGSMECLELAKRALNIKESDWSETNVPAALLKVPYLDLLNIITDYEEAFKQADQEEKIKIANFLKDVHNFSALSDGTRLLHILFERLHCKEIEAEFVKAILEAGADPLARRNSYADRIGTLILENRIIKRAAELDLPYPTSKMDQIIDKIVKRYYQVKDKSPFLNLLVDILDFAGLTQQDISIPGGSSLFRDIINCKILRLANFYNIDAQSAKGAINTAIQRLNMLEENNVKKFLISVFPNIIETIPEHLQIKINSVPPSVRTWHVSNDTQQGWSPFEYIMEFDPELLLSIQFLGKNLAEIMEKTD